MDVVKARRLAHLLTQLADKIEKPRADLEAEIDSDRYDVKKQADAVVLAARTVIQRLHDAWRGLDASQGVELDARRRETLLENCRLMGATLRTMKPQLGGPDLEAGLTDAAIGTYADDVPKHRALVNKHRALVVGLIRSHARKPGAQPVARAAEDLCDALGFPANYDSIKRVARRQRQRMSRR